MNYLIIVLFKFVKCVDIRIEIYFIIRIYFFVKYVYYSRRRYSSFAIILRFISGLKRGFSGCISSNSRSSPLSLNYSSSEGSTSITSFSSNSSFKEMQILWRQQQARIMRDAYSIFWRYRYFKRRKRATSKAKVHSIICRVFAWIRL